MTDYTCYIYYVKRGDGHCYYYCSTANPGPEGGRVVDECGNGMMAHRRVRELNVRGSF